ncbi:MAG: TonB-dependent receptor [Saprospiraceae bacterium]|nr:TonB-dependent receptor [Saprospiraceae bacterium]
MNLNFCFLRMKFIVFGIVSILFLVCSTSGFSQIKNQTLYGTVVDKNTGENLIGVNVYVKENPSNGTVTNSYGFYSIKLTEAPTLLVFSYTGYQQREISIHLQRDSTIQVSLTEGVLLEEIIISAEDLKKNIQANEMGTVDLSVERIKSLPALLGEVDILKTLQLLPGISSATEGTAGLYVRGGGPDQNLVLLDEAVVYNTGHLLGFFSVFNSDAIKNTKLIKGSMPAEYGSRISSVIDVQMKEGNNEDFEVEGGIGLISSRLTIQGPIAKGMSSFILSGRRTYALDLAQPFISQTSFAGTNYYFYDWNAKVNYRINAKDRIYLSGYFGRDVFKFSNSDRGFNVKLPYGNSTGTFRWNRVISKNTFSNLSLIYNDYKFSLQAGQEDFFVNVRSGVEDYSVKFDVDYYPATAHHFKFGSRYTFHKLTPNLVNASNGEVDFSSGLVPKQGHELEFYASDDIRFNRKLGINAGVRLTGFLFTGPYTSSLNGEEFDQNDIVKTYLVPEPRLIFNYMLNKNSSFKGGFSIASQNIHLVSNSGSTLPADVWVPSSQIVKPQIGLQYSAGYFRNFLNDEIEASVEVYYKDLRNQIDYRESYVENFSSEIEREFVFGKGRAYGLELFIQKKKGRWNGWIGYTLSKTERWFDEIEEGRIFPAVFDRPHDVSIVQSFQINKNWQVSGTFIYATGRAFTPIQALFIIDGRPNIEYGPRNSARLDDYHRFDLSFIYKKKAMGPKKFTSSWAFSFYNLYNRQNPFFFYTSLNDNVLTGNAGATAVKVSLFPIIPAVTWNFNWTSKQ